MAVHKPNYTPFPVAPLPSTPKKDKTFREQLEIVIADPRSPHWKHDPCVRTIFKIEIVRVIISYAGTVQQFIVYKLTTRTFTRGQVSETVEVRHGIPNLGNTCFMNALLQVIARTKLLEYTKKSANITNTQELGNTQLKEALQSTVVSLVDSDSTSETIKKKANSFYQTVLASDAWTRRLRAAEGSGVQNDSLDLLLCISQELCVQLPPTSTNTTSVEETVLETGKTEMRAERERLAIQPTLLTASTTIAEAIKAQKTSRTIYRYYCEEKKDYLQPTERQVFGFHLGDEIDLKEMKDYQLRESPEYLVPGTKYYYDEFVRKLGKSYEQLEREYCESVSGENITRVTNGQCVEINPENDMLIFSVEKPQVSITIEESIEIEGSTYDLCAAIHRPSGCHYTASICDKQGHWTKYDDHRTSELRGCDNKRVRALFYKKRATSS